MARNNAYRGRSNRSGDNRNGKAFEPKSPELEVEFEDISLKVAMWETESEDDFRWKPTRVEVSKSGQEYYPSTYLAENVLDLPALAYELAVDFSADEDLAISDDLRSELEELAETLDEAFGYSERDEEVDE